MMRMMRWLLLLCVGLSWGHAPLPLADLLGKNQMWVGQKLKADPKFFKQLAHGQSPRFLWLGCSDSRVSPNTIMQLKPGEVFVHRNIANLARHTDLNFLAVLQYAVEALHIEHIIVCGHYHCGGIQAAMDPKPYDLANHWLHPVRQLYHQHQQELEQIHDPTHKANRLSELNTMAQVRQVAYTDVVQNAWHRGQKVVIHGWIFDINTGFIKDLQYTIDRASQIAPIYRLNQTG